jgi:hypothetical protein
LLTSFSKQTYEVSIKLFPFYKGGNWLPEDVSLALGFIVEKQER